MTFLVDDAPPYCVCLLFEDSSPFGLILAIISLRVCVWAQSYPSSTSLPLRTQSIDSQVRSLFFPLFLLARAGVCIRSLYVATRVEQINLKYKKVYEGEIRKGVEKKSCLRCRPRSLKQNFPRFHFDCFLSLRYDTLPTYIVHAS